MSLIVADLFCLFFFCTQTTAYEFLPSLVGSEMCIRDLCWVLGAGCWVLGVGCWVLGVGCWVLGVVWWVAVAYTDVTLPRIDSVESSEG